MWAYLTQSNTQQLFHPKIRSRFKYEVEPCLTYVSYRDKAKTMPRPRFFHRMRQIATVLNTPDYTNPLTPKTILDPYSDPNPQTSQDVLSTLLKNKIRKELTHGHPQD
jgi:hypothetical protein